jgi:hypothetical protein
MTAEAAQPGCAYSEGAQLLDIALIALVPVSNL